MQEAQPAIAPQIRCVVIDRPKPALYDALVNAQLQVMVDGTYVAALEQIGHYGSHIGTFVYRSTDKGASWASTARLDAPSAISLLENAGALYLLGVEGMGSYRGWPLIRRSTDQGETWSKPEGESNGRLRGEAILGACRGPVVVQGGRIWHPYLRTFVAPDSTLRRHALVASAALGTDLLKADSWRWTTELPLDGLKGLAWEASYLVADADAPPSFVFQSSEKTRAVASLSGDGFELKRRVPEPDWIGCDPLGLRFERDPKSGMVLSLAGFPDSTTTAETPVRRSSEVALLASADLSAWDLRTTILRGGADARFSCADWAIDGEDLLAIVAGSKGAGDESRVVLFLRVPKFRERKFGDAPALAPATSR
jgi:hypothetical protein